MNDNTVYSYINDIAQRLKEPRKYGDVSLMIGAGFSKNAQSKGMASMQPPNWSELAEKNVWGTISRTLRSARKRRME